MNFPIGCFYDTRNCFRKQGRDCVSHLLLLKTYRPKNA